MTNIPLTYSQTYERVRRNIVAWKDTVEQETGMRPEYIILCVNCLADFGFFLLSFPRSFQQLGMTVRHADSQHPCIGYCRELRQQAQE